MLAKRHTKPGDATGNGTESRIEVAAVFPTPIMRVRGFVSDTEASELRRSIARRSWQANRTSASLAHTAIDSPGLGAGLTVLAERLAPLLSEFGVLIFGESLEWTVTGIWGNQLKKGGFQQVHNHANSFVSGIVYVGGDVASCPTVFHKVLGGRDFVFANSRSRANAFTAATWKFEETTVGDLVLFPSYLMHHVPINASGTRFTVAFNSVPRNLYHEGYELGFIRVGSSER